MKRIVALSCCLWTGFALAGAECDGVTAGTDSLLRSGRDELPILPTAKCLDGLISALKAVGDLGQVTVTARATDKDRVGSKALGKAQRLGQVLQERLPGVAVSAVAIRAEGAAESNVRIGFVRKGKALPFGRVSFCVEAEVTGKPCSEGRQLSLDDEVRTGAQGGAVVSLDDGTRLLLEPSTAIRFNEARVTLLGGSMGVSSKPGSAGRPLERGGIRVRLNPGSALRISEDGQEARVQLHEGSAEVASSSGALLVEQGEGARPDASGLRKHRVPAEAPAFVALGENGPAQEVQLAKHSPEAAEIERAVRKHRPAADEGAPSLIVELARDTGFSQAVRFVAAKPWPPELPEGTWYFRVRTVDEDGFFGAPSKVRSVRGLGVEKTVREPGP